MMRFTSLAQAEKATLGGNNESQDSQAILDALRAEFGVGKASSSPPRPLFRKPSLVHVYAAPMRATQQGSTARRDVLTNYPLGGDSQTADSLPDTAPVDGVDGDDNANDAKIVTRFKLDHEQRSTTLSAEIRPLVPGRKMDGSQQTPTQVNQDRDYEILCEPLPSSPADCTQLTSNEEPRTLDPTDTGAVNFGSLSEFPRPSSQVTEDGGFENTRGQWRLPADVATPYKPHDLQVPLETPALSKNPFRRKSNGGTVPYGGTQLFGQTQTLSPAVKLASPTSSRPSPAVRFNLVETSPLKNRTNVSSPTDIQTSSPTKQLEVPATVLKDKDLSIITEGTPAPRQTQKDDLIPESPTTSRLAVGYQPMAYYEPMKHSQERKGSDERLQKSRQNDDSDDETFQMLERKRRVERKRAAAAKEMDKVSFVRTQRKASPPFERHGKRRKVGVTADYGEDKEMKEKRANGTTQPFARDSQKVVSRSSEPPPVELTKSTPGEAADVEAEASAFNGPSPSAQKPEPKAVVHDEIIPATSPLRSPSAGSRPDAPSASEPELPRLRRSGREQEPESADPSSLPPLRRPPRRTYGRRGREPRTRLAVVSSADTDADGLVRHDGELPPEQPLIGTNRGAGTEKPEDTIKPPSAPMNSNLEAPRRIVSTRSTPRRSPVTHKVATMSSSLADLSGTPVPSSKTSPGTQNSIASERPESISLVYSEKGAKAVLRDTTRHVATSKSPQALNKAVRLSRRSLRLDSDSTDDLHRSPSKSRFRPSLGQAPRSRRVFEGMVFALSFSDNLSKRKELEAKITQAGGFILQDGFQELFEPSPVLHTSSAVEESHDCLTLERTYIDCGFAAVIADSHSRKAKYMQALALGLPCLAPQWTYMCLKKGEIVDWMPYLLCAGQSQVLGNAVRSRTLTPYHALDARLADILEERDKLLDGQRLLIIMDHKKSRKETKQQYLFLALALGPLVIFRVSTVQQAGAVIRQAEQNDSPFGWVYMDPSTGTIDAVLAAAAAQEKGKRKRRSAGTESVGETLKVLTDELMIQSLILGRMVEGDEMA